MINISIIFPIIFFIFFYIFHIFFNYIKISLFKNPIILILFSQMLLPIYYVFFYMLDINISLNIYIYYSCIYFMLIIIYIHLYIGFLKSVSLRIIYELDKLNEKKIDMKNLTIIYSSDEIIKFRINSLINNGWLLEDKFLKCSNKTIILVKINLLFQKIYKLKITG